MKDIINFLSGKFSDYLEKAKLTEHTFMIIVAIIIGVLAGFAAIGIRFMIETISEISFPGEYGLLQNIIDQPWYIKILVPVIGAAIVGPLIYFFAPEAKGHGVPEVMQAILLRGGKIRPRVAVIKAIASAITIGTGGSVGREGPIIQIGSSLGSTVGQFLKVPTNRLKTLVGCGAAAGIAAAFNAPIAGALFAVEIILMDFAVAQFSPIVIASVMATVISHNYEGNFAAFQVPPYLLVSSYELSFYFLLGAISGVVSWIFIKVLYYFEDFYDNKVKMPDYIKPVTGGFGIGLLALVFPEVMGVGYDTINNALHGNLIWSTALILIFIKIFSSSLTLGSGSSGGIFAPSLFMGATLGVFFGQVVNYIFPEITGSPGAYALVAMGGLVAGTTRAPITAIIMVFELTKDYSIILPLMITCIISTILSSKLSRESIYTLKLLLRNINIKEGTETNVMQSIFVKDVVDKNYDPIFLGDNFSKIVNKVIRGSGPEFPVISEDKKFFGIISLHDIKDSMLDKDNLENLLIATDLMRKTSLFVTLEDNCGNALDKLTNSNLEGIPVIDNQENKRLIGMLWKKDILDEYQKEIERREITSSLASSITMKDDEKQVHFLEGYSIAEIKPPDIFIGKSIKELKIRAEYGVDVLSVKQKDKSGEKITAIPNPNYIIKEFETIVVAGEIKNINMLKNL